MSDEEKHENEAYFKKESHRPNESDIYIISAKAETSEKTWDLFKKIKKEMKICR